MKPSSWATRILNKGYTFAFWEKARWMTCNTGAKEEETRMGTAQLIISYVTVYLVVYSRCQWGLFVAAVSALIGVFSEWSKCFLDAVSLCWQIWWVWGQWFSWGSDNSQQEATAGHQSMPVFCLFYISSFTDELLFYKMSSNSLLNPVFLHFKPHSH